MIVLVLDESEYVGEEKRRQLAGAHEVLGDRLPESGSGGHAMEEWNDIGDGGVLEVVSLLVDRADMPKLTARVARCGSRLPVEGAMSYL